MYSMIVTETVIYTMMLVGAFLMIAESFSPGAHFIVVGISLLMAGIAGAIVPVYQIFFIFTVFIATSLITFVIYRRYSLYGNVQQQATTSDSDDLVSKRGVVTEKVTKTNGHIKLTGGGSTYSARSPSGNISVGTDIIIYDSGGGNIMKVVPEEEGAFDSMLHNEPIE